jgi:hypothetical protein
MFANTESKALGEPDQNRFVRAEKMMARNSMAAVAELEQLAQDGSMSSMLCIGYFYESGEFGPINYGKAREWYRKAADAGSLQAYYRLGRILFKEGRCDDAFGVFSYAASKGYPPAMHFLGKIYLSGAGVSLDAFRAETLFRQASEKGSLAAKLALAGVLLRERSGLFRMLAGVWFLISAIPPIMWIMYKIGRQDERLL